MTEDEIKRLLDEVYEKGGNYEGPVPGINAPRLRGDEIPVMHPEGNPDVSYSDAYFNRIDGPDDNIHRTLRRIEAALQGKDDEFDAVVVTGLSGTIPAAIYCYLHGKQLVVVRKDDDRTHGARVEGDTHFAVGTPYIILDDFISMGGTQRRLYIHLRGCGHGLPKYVVLYRGNMHPEVAIPFTTTEGKTFRYIVGRRVNTRESLFIPEFRRQSSISSNVADWATDCAMHLAKENE